MSGKPNETLTIVDGVKVGHAQDTNARTGCTVLLFEPAATVACDARGGWPGTYDTHSVEVTKTFVAKHAVFLTGGDVFGFDTALGIRKYLLEKSLASKTEPGKLPGIVGANIFDIGFAEIEKASYPSLGYQTCVNASSEPVPEGNVGAGIGGTVGKLRGLGYACKGGLGSSAVRVGRLKVGAIVVTNAVGNVYEQETNKTIAGVRREDGRGFVEMDDMLPELVGGSPFYERLRATTIGAVATNASLNHEQLIKVVQMAHNGYAMSIRPVHTCTDGDTLFAITTDRETDFKKESIVDVIGHLAAQQVARAVVRSVKAARTLNGIPGLAD